MSSSKRKSIPVTPKLESQPRTPTKIARYITDGCPITVMDLRLLEDIGNCICMNTFKMGFALVNFFLQSFDTLYFKTISSLFVELRSC